MNQVPESLRRILAKQKLEADPTESLRRALAKPKPERTETTLVWRDGETWRRTDDGPWRQLKPTIPLQ